MKCISTKLNSWQTIHLGIFKFEIIIQEFFKLNKNITDLIYTSHKLICVEAATIVKESLNAIYEQIPTMFICRVVLLIAYSIKTIQNKWYRSVARSFNKASFLVWRKP